MNRFSIFLFLLFALPTLLISQDLEDQTFDWTRDLQSNLGLNILEAQEADIILNDYNDKLQKMIREGDDDPDKSFTRQYEAIKTTRDKKLGKIFNRQQMTLFNKIEQGMVDNLKNYYAKLVKDLSGNSSFSKDLMEFQQENQEPVILLHKENLGQNITEEDGQELIQLGQKFQEMLSAALALERTQGKEFSETNLKQLIRSTNQSNPTFKPIWRRIKSLSKKYKNDVNAEYAGLDRYSVKWSSGVKSILQKYIPFEEQKQLDGVFFMLNQYGISRKISQLSFLLFDKNDVSSYFDIQSAAQELFLKKSL